MLCFGRSWQFRRIPALYAERLKASVLKSQLAQLKNVLYSDLSVLLGIFFNSWDFFSYGFLGYSLCKSAMEVLTDLFLIAFLPFVNCSLPQELRSLRFATVNRHILSTDLCDPCARPPLPSIYLCPRIRRRVKKGKNRMQLGVKFRSLSSCSPSL